MSKKDGVIYTPREVVNKMLDMAGYCPAKVPALPDMHIMDNSCGSGNILVVAAERMCEALERNAFALGLSPAGKYDYFQKKMVEHIHGIELSVLACAECRDRLNKVAESHLCQPVDWDWDIRCCDSLAVDDRRTYDFVICNPPYIRVHDWTTDLWDSDFQPYEFVEQGMKDMYLAFFELGLRQVNDLGTMCYITPSSWFTSTAGKKCREYMYENHLIDRIYDYGHIQVFENATTYVEITVVKPINKRIPPKYLEYEDAETGEKYDVPYESFNINDGFYFAEDRDLKKLEEIQASKGPIKVKNGFATLADDIFIREEEPENKDLFIPVFKASTGKMAWCVYPYTTEGRKAENEQIKGLLADFKERLLKRKTDEPWWAFGRTQAINDTYKDKWCLKSIIRTVDDVNPIKVPAGSGVYGGLYILCDDERQLECLKTEEFMNYIKSLRKYKSGGYYTYSSKDLERFLNWNYREKK